MDRSRLAVELQLHSTIVNDLSDTRGGVMVETQNVEVKPSWDKLVQEIWDEIARTHTLIDKVSDELSRLVCDDCSEPLQILEKNAESRVLQAYYRGLRYAFDRTPNMWNQTEPGSIH
jgi:hypothetical protein